MREMQNRPDPWPNLSGEMARRVRVHDWSASALGPIERWPARLRAIVEIVLASPVVSTVALLEQRLLIYNDAAARLYGARHPEALGRPLRETFAASYPVVAPLYDRVFGGETVTVESQPLAVGTGTRSEVFDAYLTPVRDDENVVFGVHMVGFEISARLEAEAALIESEARFRAFVTASADVVYRMSPDWLELRQLHGRAFLPDTAEPSVSWMERYIHEQDQSTVRAAIARAVTAKSVFELEHRVIRVDGTPGWTRSRAVPIFGADGEIKEWFGTATDITAMKRAEVRLRDNEERLRLAVEAARLATWDWDLDTGRVDWSDHHFTLQGYAVGEVEPGYEAGISRVHPDDRKDAEAALREARDQRQPFIHEFRSVHPDGKLLWLAAHGGFFYDESGKPRRMIGVMQDVTGRREWQERQTVLVRELQHRTRNLMGVVHSMAERTMAASSDLADFRLRFCNRLEMLTRVQGLLSRLDEHDRVTFDQLLRSEIGALGGSSEQVVLEGPVGVRLRSSTVQTLAMALHELATNALKYGALKQSGATLTIRWSREAPDKRGRPRLRMDWRESGVTMPPDGAAPQGSGQGRELIEQALPYQIEAEVRFALEPDGLHCTILFPVSESAVIKHE